IIDARKVFELAGACFFIQAFGITRLAYVERSIHEHFNKAAGTTRIDQLTHCGAIRGVRTYERSERDQPRARKELSHGANTADVFLPVFRRKCQPEAASEWLAV